MKPGDWMKSREWTTNIGHLLAGYAWTITFAFFTARHWILYASQAALVVYIVVKEYVIDLHFESDENVTSSTVDALGYALGAGAAWAIISATYYAGVWPR